MKTILEFLINKNITRVVNDKFKVIKAKENDFSGHRNVYVIFKKEEEFNKLIKDKNFSDRNIPGIKKRIKLQNDCFPKDFNGIGLTYGSKDGVLYDASFSPERIENDYNVIAEITPDKFNMEYWKENDWVIPWD